MMQEIKITIADIGDAEALRTLSERTFRDAFGPANTQRDMDKYIVDAMSLEKLREELENEQNTFFLAWHYGVLIGYARVLTGTTPDQLNDTTALEISRLYVAQEHQNKKAGNTLLQHCLSYAASLGYAAVWLGVWEHNPNAIRFYQRYGFEVFGSHGFLLGYDNQTDLLMKKVLFQITTTS